VAITPQAAIDAANEVYGANAGFRALHAKGTLFRGTFTATAAAGALTRAPHMQGAQIPATFRLSNANGNPYFPDYLPDPRGLAVKLYLPDGSRTGVMTVTSPRSPVRTPEAFIELMKAQGGGVAAASKLPRFRAAHPETARALPVIAPTLLPPESCTVVRYHRLHAFKWVDGSGGERYVRYTLVPEHPGSRLMPPRARRRGRDYLQDEIREPVRRGPVRFEFEVQVASAGDPVTDPNAVWPAGRRRVHVGTFELDGPDTSRERDGDMLVFDPTRLTDGIECSDDPVLRFRPQAYSESVRCRTGG
jgi:catalase